MKKIERESNFESLRIIAILMVLVLHYFNGNMGGGFYNVAKGSTNYYVMYFIESLCIIAVNIFILISGYFMCKKQNTKISKILNLVFLTSFYSVGFYILSIIMGDSTFSIFELVYSLVPFTYGSKWFIGSYVVLSLIAPYLNLIYKNLEQKQMLRLILILIITISIIPTILPDISYNDNGYGVLSFIMLYTIGAYIRLYYVNNKNTWYYFMIYLTSTLIICCCGLITSRAWKYNLIFNIISSIALFLIFTKISFKSRLVNSLSTFSFAVYIIHTEPRIKDLLYNSLLKCDKFWNSNLFFIHMIISIILIYLMCILIEYIRRIIFKILKINIGLA